MYGNFTTNLYKIEFTQYLKKYRIELSPSISEVSITLKNELHKKILNSLYKSINDSFLIINDTLYTQHKFEEPFNFTILLENVLYEIIFSQLQFVSDQTEKILVLQSIFSEFSSNSLKYQLLMDNYFNPFDEIVVKEKDLLYWKGFSLKIQGILNDTYLQIIPKYLIFSKKDCLTLLNEMLDREESDKYIENYFEGKLIKTRFFGVSLFYRIKSINFKQNANLKININNEDINYYQYFKNYCGLDIDLDENQPLFLIESLNDSKKKMYILPQLCILIQDYFSINKKEKISMHIRPYDIALQINKCLGVILTSKEFNKYLSEWKINIANSSLKTSLFRLEPGTMILQNIQKPLNNLIYSYSDSAFDNYLKSFLSEKFLSFPKLNNWILFLSREDIELGNFLLMNLQKLIQQHSYTVAKPTCVIINDISIESWKETIEKSLNDHLETQFVMLIIPKTIDNESFQNELSIFVTGEHGLANKIIQSKIIEDLTVKNDESYFSCVLSQISANMGFVPWKIQGIVFNSNPSMVIGIYIDIVDDDYITVSFVASMNKDYSKYYSGFKAISIKEKSKNIILETILCCVDKFYEIHNMHLENIVILKSGLNLFADELEAQEIDKDINHNRLNKGFPIIKLVFLSVIIDSNLQCFSAENQNFMNYNNVGTPAIGSSLIINQSQFYIFLKRNDRDFIVPTKFIINFCYLDQESPEYNNFIKLLQGFIFQLVYLNYNLSNESENPAPLEYAFKFSKFISLIMRNDDIKNKKELKIKILSNLYKLSETGKLYFI